MPDTTVSAAVPAPSATSTPSLIHARGLTKRFGEMTAVDAIDFDVAPGELFGFLGPNGAGKTSTMRMIGCVSPHHGRHAAVLGLDPARDGRASAARLGVVPQQDTLDKELTVRENLVIYGRYFGLPGRGARRADELLDFAQLDRARQRPGRAHVGRHEATPDDRPGLINEPELLLLDEPTTGLDPQARHLLWDRLYRLKQRGVTLVLTTHYMDEAEQLCDRLVVMDKATIVAEGSPRAAHRGVLDQGGHRAALRARCRRDARRPARRDRRADRAPARPRPALCRRRRGGRRRRPRSRAPPETVLVRRSSLEDVFLRLTGRSLVD